MRGVGIRWHMPARRQTALTCVFSALAVIVSAGLFSAAALAPAPPAVIPLVVVVCIGAPALAAWELSKTIGARRRPSPSPLDSTALTTLRRHLDELPETQHPLGL
jgi:hypothetical protein